MSSTLTPALTYAGNTRTPHHSGHDRKSHAMFTVYELPSSSSSGSSVSTRSFSSLSPSDQKRLLAALKNLDPQRPKSLLELCSVCDAEGKSSRVAGVVHAMTTQAWTAINKSHFSLRFWRPLPKVHWPQHLEPILGGVAWGLGQSLQSALCQAIFSLYSSPDMINSGAVAISTSGEFILLWRTQKCLILESSRHWANWFHGRRTRLFDLLENGDFWESGQFRTHTGEDAEAPEGVLIIHYDDMDRLLAFVDAAQCPFAPEEPSKQKVGIQGKAVPGGNGTEEQKVTEVEKSVSWSRTLGTLRRRERKAEMTRVSLDHIDKAFVRRVHAVFPAAEGECAAYVAANMPDPRVIAAAFANLPIELRHWRLE